MNTNRKSFVCIIDRHMLFFLHISRRFVLFHIIFNRRHVANGSNLRRSWCAGRGVRAGIQEGRLGMRARMYACTRTLHAQWVLSLDMVANDMADKNVCVQATDSLVAQAQQVTADVGAALGGRRVDALLCVAGGFAMAKANSDGVCVRAAAPVTHVQISSAVSTRY